MGLFLLDKFTALEVLTEEKWGRYCVDRAPSLLPLKHFPKASKAPAVAAGHGWVSEEQRLRFATW